MTQKQPTTRPADLMRPLPPPKPPEQRLRERAQAWALKMAALPGTRVSAQVDAPPGLSLYAVFSALAKERAPLTREQAYEFCSERMILDPVEALMEWTREGTSNGK